MSLPLNLAGWLAGWLAGRQAPRASVKDISMDSFLTLGFDDSKSVLHETERLIADADSNDSGNPPTAQLKTILNNNKHCYVI